MAFQKPLNIFVSKVIWESFYNNNPNLWFTGVKVQLDLKSGFLYRFLQENFERKAFKEFRKARGSIRERLRIFLRNWKTKIVYSDYGNVKAARRVSRISLSSSTHANRNTKSKLQKADK